MLSQVQQQNSRPGLSLWGRMEARKVERRYQMVVRYLTSNGVINTELIANPCAESLTRVNIFQLMNETFDNIAVDWG